MKPLDYPLLADENIAPGVVAGLRARGCDVRTTEQEALNGRTDAEVLTRASSTGRMVVTHDLAFGRSAIRAGTEFIGIVYVRPGHISAEFVLETIDAVRTSWADVTPPFLVVAERRGTTVRVRVRTGPPW